MGLNYKIEENNHMSDLHFGGDLLLGFLIVALDDFKKVLYFFCLF